MVVKVSIPDRDIVVNERVKLAVDESENLAQRTILLTSFAIWKASQRSNASDDLLLEIAKTNIASSLHLFRQLPVNVPVAKELVIGKIQQVQPHLVLCCGMAESRSKLNVESRAAVGDHVLHSALDLEALTMGLHNTEISEDAGRFVCNGLYYAILNYLQGHHTDARCLFVHVPVLTTTNREKVVADFSLILERVLTT